MFAMLATLPVAEEKARIDMGAAAGGRARHLALIEFSSR
jgi:hypothetical protein